MAEIDDTPDAPDAGECTERQKRLVEALFSEAKGNQTKAARMSGCEGSDEVCASYASTTLRIPKVAAYRRKVELATRSERTAAITEIREFLTATMRDDPELSEHELEFTVTGEPIADPRKVARARVDGALTHDADVYFRRRAKKSERIQAATTLLKMSGALIDNIEVRVAGGLKTTIPLLQKHMTPAAYLELIEAFQKLAAEQGSGT